MSELYEWVTRMRAQPYKSPREAHQMHAKLTEALRRRAGPIEPLACSVLRAFRGVCRYEACAQYEKDIQIIAAARRKHAEVRAILHDSGFADDEITTWFKYAKGVGCVHTEDGWFMFAEAAHVCDNCDYFYADSSHFSDVRTRLSQGRFYENSWCSDCIECEAFFCEASRAIYSRASFEADADANGLTICQQFAEISANWQRDIARGAWRNVNDRFAPSISIPAYHAAKRLWSLATAERSRRAFYGFEIEVEFPDKDHRGEFWQSYLGDCAWACGERDGSLDDDAGLEIITQPFALQELRAPGNALQCLLTKCVESACVTPETYGLHITTNWNRLAPDHITRVMRFMLDALRLVEFIGLRKANAHATYPCYVWAPRRAKDGAMRDASRGHTCMLHRRANDSVEVRIFRSTVEWAQLMACVELLEAATAWTANVDHDVGWPMASVAFRHWLRGQEAAYPHLYARFYTPKQKDLQLCA